MRITIHLVARLFRVPLLRLDGHITLVDDEPRSLAPTDRTRAPRPDLPVGRLLALAEADLAAAEDRRAGLSAVP
ncbi:hypothetical protein [Nocardioides cavernae]|uniref:hypothetical protein n=1 Tax=Nocardioides cavernae TaxID=1921566 RepID=UPI0019594679|nr:hypothetical protein [Nocardioides cavernae]